MHPLPASKATDLVLCSNRECPLAKNCIRWLKGENETDISAPVKKFHFEERFNKVRCDRHMAANVPNSAPKAAAKEQPRAPAGVFRNISLATELVKIMGEPVSKEATAKPANKRKARMFKPKLSEELAARREEVIRALISSNHINTHIIRRIKEEFGKTMHSKQINRVREQMQAEAKTAAPAKAPGQAEEAKRLGSGALQKAMREAHQAMLAGGYTQLTIFADGRVHAIMQEEKTWSIG